jgi:hypothetical protein
MTHRCRKYALVAALAGLLAMGAAQAAPRVGDFALLDQHGDFYQLSYYKNAKAFALMVLPSEDTALIDRYQALAAKYRGQEFIFAAIRIGAVANREALRKRLSDSGVTLPVLLDESESVAELLNLTRAGEALLLDPTQQQLLFRGPMGPALALALKQRAANETIAPALVEISGPLLSMSNARKQWRDPKSVSYSKEVAPLLEKNCIGCHRAGGIAPFAMDSWGVVLGWSPMIKEVLLTKRMPPGQLDPAIGDFKNGRALSSKDIATIVRWIDAGASQDGNRDPLAELPAKREKQWAFGEPDHIIEVPPRTVPALGSVDVARSVIPVALPKDKWLRASQFMPGDERVLHHAELFIAPARFTSDPSVEQARFSANALPPYYGVSDPRIAAFSPFVPGDEPLVWPRNTGGVIAKDANLVVQLHYATIGREVNDKSRIGFWFHDDAAPPKDHMALECACLEPARWKSIPPRMADFKAQATLTVAKDAYLYGVLPRMHYRGSAIRIDAVRLSGEVEPLLNVPKYSYNWQVNYQLREPKLIPAGTKLVASARYDNSPRNPFNPDPSQTVGWGLESFNEELAVVFQLQYVD